MNATRETGPSETAQRETPTTGAAKSPERVQTGRRPAPGAQQNKRKPKRSIRLDRPRPSDVLKYELAFFCENCSHFSPRDQSCSMGFRAQHTREAQMKIYELTGGMAMCRALEID